ncbi:unnamed protein product [Prorocentrum cordatum]|uniref:Uncharacterized protein n=1 Tax=Prorocentrum cordatum TaxID=2364126 RepID=A0ABN9W1C4_9DINO|nr:unnamed protein product [Polarella glacialis]
MDGHAASVSFGGAGAAQARLLQHLVAAPGAARRLEAQVLNLQGGRGLSSEANLPVSFAVKSLSSEATEEGLSDALSSSGFGKALAKSVTKVGGGHGPCTATFL